MAAMDGKAFNQMQLQELVYIAHGWCLSISGQPLTGDRPEALEHGPEYRRLAVALASYGLKPVSREIRLPDVYSDRPTRSELDQFERDLTAQIYNDYGTLEAAQLAAVTRRPGTPWAQVFAGGAGKSRDIPHELIRAQFVECSAKFAE